jgi:hypothetical protein
VCPITTAWFRRARAPGFKAFPSSFELDIDVIVEHVVARKREPGQLGVDVDRFGRAHARDIHRHIGRIH